MDYLQKNLALIEKSKEDLYKRIIEYTKDRQDEGILLEYAPAENKEPCLYIQKGQKIYRLNSQVNPSYEAKKWAEQYDGTQYQSVIEVFGMGSGAFVREIVAKYSEKTPILIYEPSREVLLQTLCSCDMTDILEKEHVFILSGKEDLEVYGKMLTYLLGWQTISFQKQIVLPFYDEIFLEEYKEFLQTIQEAIMAARLQMNTSVRFGKSLAKNAIINLRHFEGASLLTGLNEETVKDTPVILVAAGPSLDKNVEQLRQAKGKALIVAVDRAINSMLEAGIQPDLTATIDPEKAVANYERAESQELPLLCLLESNSEILDKHKGKKIFMHKCSYNYKMYEHFGYQEEPIATGGSVATDTFISLLDAGFKTVIMVGQDLAIYGDHTHANAAMEGNQIFTTAKEDRILVPGNLGGEVETREDFYHYLKWYGEVIKDLSHDYTIVNATEGGARIEGTKVTTLAAAIEEYCTKEIDVKALLEEAELLVKEEGQLQDALSKMQDGISNMKKSSKEALNLTYDLIRNAVQKNIQNSKAKQLGNKLSSLNQKMLDNEMYHLVDIMMSSDVNSKLSDIYATVDNVYEDTRKTYEYSKYFYESMMPCLDQILEYIEDTLENISSR